MLTIYKKEITSFLSSLIAYITIVVFLVITSLFLWVFPDTSVLEYGFASLDSLFTIAPWVFLLLIPAITMRSFSEEKKTGTIELLATRPVSDLHIILGKYFACFSLAVFALIPTVIYYITLYYLAVPVGNIDTGAIIGSYIGLLLLAASFTAIGIFASSIRENQIEAFVIAVFLCFFCFYGFESISSLSLFGAVDNFIAQLGINEHYLSISRGVLDTRDLIYFLSFIALFVVFTKTVLESRKW